MDNQRMQHLIEALAEKAQREAQQKRIDETSRLLASLYDKAAAYTNLIIVAGYAGFFAVWGTVRSDLSKGEMVVSALCMAFSLMVFVLWEVSVMLFSSRNLGELRKALEAPAEEFEKRLQQAQDIQAKRTIRIRRVWFFVLVFTIVPGLVAAAILLGAFVRQLLALL